MRRLFTIAALLFISLTLSGQKSRVLSVFQMIESGKYEDAKEAVELAIWNDKTSKWPRTYYAKAMLCHKAFDEGFEKNDTKKTRLYPDQLFLAYDAYEKALELDSRKKIHSLVETQYYGLANSFQKLGERHYLKREYAKAMSAFEHALLISKSPLISVETDTSLVYNTAMAAYESRNWEKAILFLTGLNQDAYSPNSAQLLYNAYAASGDSASGEAVLVEGVESYDYNQEIVLQLVDLWITDGRQEEAMNLLDEAIGHKPENYFFPWTRARLFHLQDRYQEAISDLKNSNKLASAEAGICYDLGISYFNIGVEIEESARKIKNNSEYQAARLDAKKSYMDAVSWLEKAYAIDPGHQSTISKLSQLYGRLQLTEKEKKMEILVR